MGKNVSLLAYEMNGPMGQLFCQDANGTGLPTKCAQQQRKLALAARRAEVPGHHGYASDMASLRDGAGRAGRQGTVYRAGPLTPLPADLQRELKRACEYRCHGNRRVCCICTRYIMFGQH
jgi:hypothetical protein